jgi:IclR family acetate operon transcriptional repressor
MRRERTAQNPEKQAVGPRSLSRILGLFRVLARSSNGQTLAELNAALKSPKSSLLNLLRPLVAEGYLTYEDGCYRLGTSIFRLAANIMSGLNFSNMLRPYLRELAERCHETVYIAVLDRVNKNTVYVDVIESHHPVRYAALVGSQAVLYSTAAGRVLLAFASEKFQAEYMRTVKLEALTPWTMTSKKALLAELKKVRAAGFATSVSEAVLDAAAIAAPIFGADGEVKAAIVIGGPAGRLEPKFVALQPVIKDVAERASGFNSREKRADGVV